MCKITILTQSYKNYGVWTCLETNSGLKTCFRHFWWKSWSRRKSWKLVPIFSVILKIENLRQFLTNRFDFYIKICEITCRIMAQQGMPTNRSLLDEKTLKYWRNLKKYQFSDDGYVQMTHLYFLSPQIRNFGQNRIFLLKYLKYHGRGCTYQKLADSKHCRLNNSKNKSSRFFYTLYVILCIEMNPERSYGRVFLLLFILQCFELANCW